MKKKTYQKLTAFIVSVLLIGFFIVIPVVRADNISTTSNNLVPLLQQLVQLLMQRVQELEQQLAAKQSVVNPASETTTQSSSTALRLHRFRTLPRFPQITRIGAHRPRQIRRCPPIVIAISQPSLMLRELFFPASKFKSAERLTHPTPTVLSSTACPSHNLTVAAIAPLRRPVPEIQVNVTDGIKTVTVGLKNPSPCTSVVPTPVPPTPQQDCRYGRCPGLPPANA